MIGLAVIDDEELILSEISRHILSDDLLSKSVEIYLFHSAEEFIKELNEGLHIQIVISDIEMPGLDGISFGAVMQRDYSDICLIFLTSHPEFALKSYEIGAYQYILKETMEERLPKILRKITAKIQKEHHAYRLIGTEKELQKVCYKDILFIQKLKGGKYVEYHTVKGIFRERISLGQLIKELQSPEFMVAGRSCIINIKQIESLRGATIYLSNGEEIPIVRTRTAAVKREIHERWRYFD